MGRDSRILFRQILTSSVELFGIGHEAPRRPSAHIGSTSHSQHRSIHRPIQHLPTFPKRRTTAWPEGRSARRGNGFSQLRVLPLLANFHCFKGRTFSQNENRYKKKRPANQKKSNSLQKRKTQFLFFIIYSLPFPASPQPSEPHSSHPAEEQYSE